MSFDDERSGVLEFNPVTVEELTSTPSAKAELDGCSEKAGNQMTVARAIVKMLEQLNVTHAFGILGAAITPVVAELEQSSIQVHHYRHESGAAFAACEAYFASETYSDEKNADTPPVAVFTTTGPGVINALTGLFAARWEGAKVIFLSGATSSSQRGRWAFQETSTYTMPADLFVSGTLFDYAITPESAEELPEVFRRVAKGLRQPGGFIAHLNIPTGLQSCFIEEIPLSVCSVKIEPTIATKKKAIKPCADCLLQESFAIWVGFGARHAAKEIRQLAEETGAMVICSPRGKGIFPETHPQFVGVTGLGGDEKVIHKLHELSSKRILVLGTALAEWSSFWNPELVPEKGFIHVDPNPEVPGVAYPSVPTVCVYSEIRTFVQKLRKRIQKLLKEKTTVQQQLDKKQSETEVIPPRSDGLVHPHFLMDRIQRLVVENSSALVMVEPGNSMAWGINRLKFTEPGRFRTSTRFASMGHMSAGVVGATAAGKHKAVAIVGDGSMLMNGCEVSTAVKYEIPAVWVVLNDARYNMCHQGMVRHGFKGIDVGISQVDFAAIAEAMGAESVRVTKDADVGAALERALASTKPFVIDVVIEPDVPAPIGGRIKSLVSQGLGHE
jgi:acetolactate synthase-1/2/3 large subunit